MEQILTKYNKKPIIVDLYTIQNLKASLDDLLSEFCNNNGYKENYFMTDIQNAVGVVSIFLTLIVLAFSYCCKFDDIKDNMAICLYIYFAINILCGILMYFKEGKLVFDKIDIETSIDKTKIYNITIYSKEKNVLYKYNKSIFDLFYETGKLDHELFLKDMTKLFKN